MLSFHQLCHYYKKINGKNLVLDDLGAIGFNHRGRHVYLSYNGKVHIFELTDPLHYFNPKPVFSTSLNTNLKTAEIVAPLGASTHIGIHTPEERKGSLNRTIGKYVPFEGTSSGSNSFSHGRRMSISSSGRSSMLAPSLAVHVYCIHHSIGFIGAKKITANSVEKIVNIVMHTHFVLVVYVKKIVIYDNDGDIIFSYDTYKNPKGIVTVAKDKIAFPSKKGEGWVSIIQDFRQRAIWDIKAHSSEIGNLVLNHTGDMLATASIHGKSVHVYQITSHDEIFIKQEQEKNPDFEIKYQELIRGKTSNVIYSIAFSTSYYEVFEHKPKTRYFSYVKQIEDNFSSIRIESKSVGDQPIAKHDGFLAVLSASGTLHVFNLEKEEPKSYIQSFMGFFGENGKRGYVKHGVTNCPATIAFDERYHNLIHMINGNGDYSAISFDKEFNFKEWQRVNLAQS